MTVASQRENEQAVAAFRAWLVEALASGRNDEIVETVTSCMRQLADRATVAELRLALERRQKSGRRTEKMDAAQLSLLLQLLGGGEAEGEELEPVEEPDDVTEDDLGLAVRPEGAPERRKPKRRKLPEHLPRDEARYELAAAERACATCDGELAHLGDDVSETLVLVPAQFRVQRHVRARYACPRCKDGVTTAPGPSKPVAGGFADASLLAHIAISKYEDHLPLQRLSGIYRRGGVHIPVSTLCDQVGAVAALVEPLARRIRERALAAHVVQTDASGLKVLDRDHPDGIRAGTMWCYVGDRKWVFFDYARTGAGDDGPWRVLAGREGYIQADASSTFDRLFNGAVAHAVEVGCWAHARRKFFALKDADPRAAWPLQLIGKLFRVEKDATTQGLDPDARRDLRRARSATILARLQTWLARTASREPPASALHKACAYSLNHWQALTRFLDDGRLTLTNNLCELQIRSLAVGRKNYLFAGADTGAERAAALYTVLRTAALHGVDTFAYLEHVIATLAGDWPMKRLDELLPDRWQAARDPAPGAETAAA